MKRTTIWGICGAVLFALVGMLSISMPYDSIYFNAAHSADFMFHPVVLAWSAIFRILGVEGEQGMAFVPLMLLSVLLYLAALGYGIAALASMVWRPQGQRCSECPQCGCKLTWTQRAKLAPRGAITILPCPSCTAHLSWSKWPYCLIIIGVITAAIQVVCLFLLSITSGFALIPFSISCILVFLGLSTLKVEMNEAPNHRLEATPTSRRNLE